MTDSSAVPATTDRALRNVQAWTHPGLMLDPSHEPAPTVLHWTRPGQLEAKCATCGLALVALDAAGVAIRAEIGADHD